MYLYTHLTCELNCCLFSKENELADADLVYDFQPALGGRVMEADVSLCAR